MNHPVDMTLTEGVLRLHRVPVAQRVDHVSEGRMPSIDEESKKCGPGRLSRRTHRLRLGEKSSLEG